MIIEPVDLIPYIDIHRKQSEILQIYIPRCQLNANKSALKVCYSYNFDTFALINTRRKNNINTPSVYSRLLETESGMVEQRETKP